MDIAEKLKTKTPEQLLSLLKILLKENDYIESASDGVNFVNTLQFVASKGEEGDTSSTYLKEIIEKELAK